ncbi:MAG: radical SAM protein [Candidatus Acidiferrales bacterium]
MATQPIPRSVLAPRKSRTIRSRETNLTLFPTAARHGYARDAGASLPPPEPDRSWKPHAELAGIARLAASSPLAEAKCGTEYFLLPVRSILNYCESERVPFRWTVNPYRGCEFGCHYCYARYTHEYMELDGEEFEQKIFVKQNAGELMERDLSSEAIWGEQVALGTATDPYQPAEREFGVTRKILEKMAERDGLNVSITTKSNLIVRDIELLRRIAARSSLTINMSVTTVNARLARMLEPRAPRPDLRLAAVGQLREAGLAAGVFAMPIIPGITDGEKSLDALARAAKEARAQWLGARVLFLTNSTLDHFLPFLEEKFPALARRYKAWYAHSTDPPEKMRVEIAARVEAVRRKYNLGSRPTAAEGARMWRSPQLALALGGGVVRAEA